MHHIPNQQSIQHTQLTTISYTSQQALQHLPNQQSIQNTQPLAVTNSQPSALQYDQSQAISHIPQAIDQGPVKTEYVCTVCMTYSKTHPKLLKHMVRFYDKWRKEDRGIKKGGLKDSDEHFRKKNKVVDNEAEMHGDGFKNQDIESEDESNSYSEEDN